MKTFNRIHKLLGLQVKGLDKDIQKANALIERNNGRVEKLREEISNIQSDTAMHRLDIMAAASLRQRLEDIL